MKDPITLLTTMILMSVVTLGAIAGEAPKKIQLTGPSLEAAVLYVPQNVESAINWGGKDFSKDFQEATGKTLKTTPTLGGKHRLLILPAVVDKEPILEKLEKAGKLDLSQVRGKWESYLIQAVPGINGQVPDALVVVGSSPRAVAYGLYEISEKSLGTDPTKLWTDYIPSKRDSVFWEGTSYFSGPSVKYRGYFINDEKYLLNWIQPGPIRSKNIEPEIWARIFETAARTRANFVSLPDEYNKGYLDDASRMLLEERGLFLTGNHLQGMLVQTMNFPDFCKKNGFPTEWSWVTNKQALLAFWEDKVAYNAKFKHNIWPIGLRGMDDRDIDEVDKSAPKTKEAMAAMMNEVMEAQCKLLEKYIPAKDIVTTFTMRGLPFELYKTGLLKLPKHCILVWGDSGSWATFPALPSGKELEREGGHGTYYHLTYCDNHHVEWVSPTVICTEMLKAIDGRKCSQYVMYNVGDVRELPLSIAAGFNIAWDHRPWQAPGYDQVFMAQWIRNHFDVKAGSVGERTILNLYNRYFALESDMRCTSVMEVVRPIMWDAPKQKNNDELRKVLSELNFKKDERFRVSEENLKRDEPLWEKLRTDAVAALSLVPEQRRQFYKDCRLLHIETSSGVNRFAMGLRRMIDAALRGDKAGIDTACESARSAMQVILDRRETAMHGHWENWFRGDYNWDIKWSLRPDQSITELEAFRKRLADLPLAPPAAQ
ncbi:MAG: glycosyl hydrolase 115 family protein [Akkermansiaceae bacterium]|nr:glycosyl hydrolase 115 family protein [Akkermansiaceae bacterium]